MADLMNMGFAGAYYGMQDRIRQQNDNQLNQVVKAASLADMLRKQGQEQAVRQALASGDMESLKRLPGGIQIIGQLAEANSKALKDRLQKQVFDQFFPAGGQPQQGVQQSAMGGMAPDQRRNLGMAMSLAGMPGGAAVMTDAKRLQDEAGNKAMLQSMSNQTVPVTQTPAYGLGQSGGVGFRSYVPEDTKMVTDPSTGQQIPEAVAQQDRNQPFSIAVGDQQQQQQVGGLFLPFMNSKDPVIVDAAKRLQTELDSAIKFGGPIDAKRFETRLQNLTNMQRIFDARAAAAQGKTKTLNTATGIFEQHADGTITPLLGPDGKQLQTPPMWGNLPAPTPTPTPPSASTGPKPLTQAQGGTVPNAPSAVSPSPSTAPVAQYQPPPRPPNMTNRMAQEWESIQMRAAADFNKKQAGTLTLYGGRESQMIGRVIIGANQAAKDLANVAKLPMTSSRGMFGGRGQATGIFNAGKETLANSLTTQEVQSYNVLATGFQRALAQIESAGLAPSGALTHQMDAVIYKDGDTNFTKLLKLAQTRQIVEAGLETLLSNPRIPEETKTHMKDIISNVRTSVPFLASDLLKLQKEQNLNPNITLGDVLKMKGGSPGGKPTANDFFN